MAESSDGTLLHPPAFGEEYAIIKHHIDILEDKGLAQWVLPNSGNKPSVARITAQGYEFLHKLTKKNDGLVRKFRAAKTTIEVIAALTAILNSI